MTIIPLTKWAFFVEAATTREVLDTLKKSDLREGSKYDKRYPGIIPAIIEMFEMYIDHEDPAKKYWREITTMIKKDNVVKRNIDVIEQQLWEAKENGESESAVEELTERLDETRRIYRGMNFNQLGRMFIADYGDPGIASIKLYLRDFLSFERYNLKPDFSSGQEFVTSYRKIKRAIEEREEYRKLREQVSPDSWDGSIIHDFGNGWAIWELESHNDLRLEGQVADHCIGSSDQPHCFNISEGYTRGFSLRDKNGVPWATLEFSADMTDIFQAFGRHDHAIKPEHQEMISEWLTEKYGEDHPYMTEKPEGERTGIYEAFHYYPEESEGDGIDPYEPDSWPIENRDRIAGNDFHIDSLESLYKLGLSGIDLIEEYLWLDDRGDSPLQTYGISFERFLDSFLYDDFGDLVVYEYSSPVSITMVDRVVDNFKVELAPGQDVNVLATYALGLALVMEKTPLSVADLEGARGDLYTNLVIDWGEEIWGKLDSVTQDTFNPKNVISMFDLEVPEELYQVDADAKEHRRLENLSKITEYADSIANAIQGGIFTPASFRNVISLVGNNIVSLEALYNAYRRSDTPLVLNYLISDIQGILHRLLGYRGDREAFEGLLKTFLDVMEQFKTTVIPRFIDEFPEIRDSLNALAESIRNQRAAYE